MIKIYRGPDGQHWIDGKEFRPTGLIEYKKKTLTKAVRMTELFQVETLEGVMEGQPGDMLMVGVNGEMYPCDAGVFAKTYEQAEPGVHDVDEFYMED